MLFDRWRAQRAIRTRTAPATVGTEVPERLRAVVDALKPLVEAFVSCGDPHLHLRWEGRVQLVGLDATSRSATDVRQRLVRLWHELCLQHMRRERRRVLAVVLVRPRGGEGLREWFARLDDDQGEVGVAAWRAARRATAVLLLDEAGGQRLFGGDRSIQRAVEAWSGPGS